MPIAKILLVSFSSFFLGFFAAYSVFSGDLEIFDTPERITTSALSAISNRLEKYKGLCGRYPATEVGLTALVKPSLDNCNIQESFLPDVPRDDWGDNYIYFLHNDEFYLFSKMGGSALKTSKR